MPVAHNRLGACTVKWHDKRDRTHVIRNCASNEIMFLMLKDTRSTIVWQLNSAQVCDATMAMIRVLSGIA